MASRFSILTGFVIARALADTDASEGAAYYESTCNKLMMSPLAITDARTMSTSTSGHKGSSAKTDAKDLAFGKKSLRNLPFGGNP